MTDNSRGSKPDVPDGTAPEPDEPEAPGPSRIGVIGSPSSTGEITIDLMESAGQAGLLGDLVSMSHTLSAGRHLVALGAVGEIETRNRWHEDPNMRGVLRVHGSLPHLSGDGDVRTATVQIQAVYDTDSPAPPFTTPPRESGGALGMSPSTGGNVYRVDQALVDGLVQGHAHEVVYLGRVYRSDVLLPMYVRDYTGNTDGAFHTGVFGRSGSGKTALVTYLLALQMRHRDLSVFVFDPQGQFASQRDMVLRLQDLARLQGRSVHVVSVASTLQLPPDAPLAAELLRSTRIFKQLSIKATLNQEAAADEVERLLQSRAGWYDEPADTVLRALLEDLVNDDAALQRIYSTPDARRRVRDAIQRAIDDNAAFQGLLRHYEPVHALFGPTAPDGSERTPLRTLLSQVLDDSAGSTKPYVVVDLSDGGHTPWLGQSSVKARLMRKIAGELARLAESRWRERGTLINCAVVLDEAARYATSNPENDEIDRLSSRFAQYARETRKTGLGWTFITQEVGSLHPSIFTQLRIRMYGYGLTSGSDLNKLRDEVGRGAAIDLYQSFPDPNALTDKIYPFMITGPMSPLSFTAAPLFLEVFSSRSDFVDANAEHLPRAGARPRPA